MEPVCKSWSALSTDELYAILALRAEVFVVAQRCPYQDPDGLDRYAAHLWLPGPEGVLRAYARVFGPGLKHPTAASIGRVVSAPAVRRQGYGRVIVDLALRAAAERHGAVPVWISAQGYLQRFYEGFGFERCGDDYLEDGIPHLPMLRVPR